jgi:hypothetical protein
MNGYAHESISPMRKHRHQRNKQCAIAGAEPGSLDLAGGN